MHVAGALLLVEKPVHVPDIHALLILLHCVKPLNLLPASRRRRSRVGSTRPIVFLEPAADGRSHHCARAGRTSEWRCAASPRQQAPATPSGPMPPATTSQIGRAHV